MARKGLGKGLDSLIPNIYDENFDSNSPQSLEDMLKGEEEETVEEVIEDIESKKEDEQEKEEETLEEESPSDDDEEEVEENVPEEEEPKEESQDDDDPSKDIPGDKDSEETVQTSQEIKIQQEHVDEVKEIVDKNPRITLWSSRSSAVFRYLRKTEPEFSISKEASVLIEEAVAKKYPEIWALFEDL